MTDLMSLFDVKLMVLIPVLYVLGERIKLMEVPNKFIPLILTLVSICLTMLYLMATGTYDNVALNIYHGVTQGVIASGLSVYGHEMFKQLTKSDSLQ